jgi:predicted  nucleic acid-binding Zn-ribbon protein
MMKQPTSISNQKLIKEIEVKLERLSEEVSGVKTVVKYEALKEIESIKEDLLELKANLKVYATNEEVHYISKRVTQVSKTIERVAWTVITAVILAILSLLFRNQL